MMAYRRRVTPTRAAEAAAGAEVDARRPMARLVVAVMAADGRVNPSELAALEGLGPHELPALAALEALDLGVRAELVYEEALQTNGDPVDVGAACAELHAVAPDAAPCIVAALAQIAASDGTLAPRETAVLAAVASGLGVSEGEARAIVRRATTRPPGR